MQQIGNKKVIHRRTREIICNTFDYMRITFPFEALTKIGFLRICFFNLSSENLNLPIYHSRCFGIRGGHGKSAFKLALKLSVELGYVFLSLRL
jgi:hypothetical protein